MIDHFIQPLFISRAATIHISLLLKPVCLLKGRRSPKHRLHLRHQCLRCCQFLSLLTCRIVLCFRLSPNKLPYEPLTITIAHSITNYCSMLQKILCYTSKVEWSLKEESPLRFDQSVYWLLQDRTPSEPVQVEIILECCISVNATTIQMVWKKWESDSISEVNPILSYLGICNL